MYHVRVSAARAVPDTAGVVAGTTATRAVVGTTGAAGVSGATGK